jgi:peptide chain release factor 1
MLERLGDLEREYEDVEARLADPAVIADQSRYAEVARRYKELEEIVVALTRQLRQATEDLQTAREMLSEPPGRPRGSCGPRSTEAEADVARLEDRAPDCCSCPGTPTTVENVIVEIRGAEGGEEANLFARDLVRACTRAYAQPSWAGSCEVLGSADHSDTGRLRATSRSWWLQGRRGRGAG